ncbi:MAG: sensor histidine kinase [Solirubrobacteraceae bacterium]
MRRVVWVVASPVALLLGAVSIAIAWRHPDYAFADSGPAIVAEVVAGSALISFGLFWTRRRPPAFGVLLAAGGCAWFLLEWNDPAVGSSLVFTVGLVLYAAAAPLLANALLIYPSQRLTRYERAALAVGYAGSLLVLGVLPALVYDPAAQGCALCPHNLLLVHASNGLYEAFNRAGIYIGVAWTLLVVGLLGWRLVRSSVAMRGVLAPVLAAGGAYLALVGVDFVVSLARGYLSNDQIDRRLWLGQAAAVVLLALALVWSMLRVRRIRARLARLVLDLSAAPSPGGLRHALASGLGDPDLRLAYPLAPGRYVDANGSPVDLGPRSTVLLRDGVEVARLAHKPGLLDDRELIEALVSAARLALENERLRAERLAHLADLRESRARIVDASDRVRRQLERDLHDGAQQRLVALKLDLGLFRARVQRQATPDPLMLGRIERADAALDGALDDLRVLARGLFPAVLAEEGLAAAVEALAEDEPGRIGFGALPQRRLAGSVESAAYRVIAETIQQDMPGRIRVDARSDAGVLVLEVQTDCIPDDLTGLEDRVGALDGKLELGCAANGRSMIRAEIPCGS